MTHIEAIRTRIVDLPTVRGHVLAMATLTVQSVVIVEVRFSDGSTGIGEGTAIGGLSYGAESPESIASAIDTYISPAIARMDADNVNAARHAMERAVRGNPIARSAVECALWDGLGRRLDLPVSALMGGAVRSGLECAWTLASGDGVADIEEAREMLAIRRHRQFKLKIGKRGVREDLAHVGRIAAALPAEAVLTVDVNQAWDLHDARWGLRGLQEIGVGMVEQPVPAGRVADLAALAQGYEIAVMADEGLAGPEDVLRHAAARAADAFAIKVAKSGGLGPARDAAAIGQAAGLGLYAGTMLESGVGTAAALQLFSTLPALRWGSELFGPLLMRADILETPLSYSNFQVHLPDGPGSGVSLDADLVAFHERGAPRLQPVAAQA